jgi:hypothetical protein
MSDLWTNEFLDNKRQIADPVADEVVHGLVEKGGKEAARALFDELIRNVDLPITGRFPDMDDFVKNTAALPDWADHEKIRTAHKFFTDHGPKFLIFLYHKSLPTLYVDAKGAEVLVQTGRLAHDEKSKNVFARRVAETGQFLLDVMCEGALTVNGDGIRAVQKIRLIHASVRNFIPKRHWDAVTLGKPINQEDLALTLMSFSVLLLDGLDAFGVEYSSEEAESFIHTWNVIGHFMGIQEALLPASHQEAKELVKVILDRQAASSEAGIALTEALLAFTKSNIPFHKLENTSQYLIRFLIGDAYSEMLKVLPPEGCISILIPEAVKGVFKIGERLEHKVKEPMQFFMDEFSKIAAKKMVEYFDDYKKRNFVIPEEFMKAWF